MSNTGSKKNSKKIIRSGLGLSLPFILCAVALLLFSVWLYKGVIQNNSYYKLLMNTSGPVRQQGDALDNGLHPDNIAPTPDDTEEKLETEEDKFQSPELMPILKYGQKFGTFNLEAYDYYGRPIYNCDNPDVFGYGVGRALYGMLPGQGANIVLCGHCVNSFIYLETLKIGDIIKIKTVYGIYEYEVVKRVIFEPDDTRYVLAQYDEEMLTCYTCYPYLTTLPRDKRIAVISKKISGPDYEYNSTTGRWHLVGESE